MPTDLLVRTPPVSDQDPDLRLLLSQTQGHILEKHRRDHVWNLLLRFKDPVKAPEVRAALAKLPCPIPSVRALLDEGVAIRKAVAAHRRPGPRPAVCFVGISWPGCQKLAAPLQRFPPAFQMGFRDRANNVLERPDDEWDPRWREGRFDAVLVCAAENPDLLERLHCDLSDHLQRVAAITTEKAAVIRSAPPPGAPPGKKGPAKEHFDFADGVSQPVFFEVDHDKRSTAWTSRYDPAASLNLVLIPDPLADQAAQLFGSYMAYLRIEQDVAGFHKAACELAGLVTPPKGLPPEEYAEQIIIGRRKDGTPLVGGVGHANDFDRSTDPDGGTWPLASHSSKMSVREGRDLSRRILRRGVTFEEKGAKGLLFQSFQASLEFQFEEQLRAWADNRDHPRDATGPDPLLGARPSPQHFPTTNPSAVSIHNLVKIRGGEYFYFPSIPTLLSL